MRCGNTLSCTLINPIVLSSSPRGLPDSGQSEVAEDYLRSITKKWAKSTNLFVRGAAHALRTFIENAIKERCGHLSIGGLPNYLLYDHTSI